MTYDDGFDAAAAVTDSIVDQIEALPATTAAGLGVKALAVCWCGGGGLETDLALADYDTTDLRLLAAIRRAVLAIGAGLPPQPEAKPAAAHPDAALLAYEPQLRVLVPRNRVAEAEAHRLYAQAEAEAGERPDEPHGEYMPATMAWERRAADLRKSSGYSAAWERWTEIGEVIEPICEVFRGTPARTIRGLSLKAFLATWETKPDPALVESILADLLALDAEGRA